MCPVRMTRNGRLGRKTRTRDEGFTLIEVIATLVLVGLLALMGGALIVSVTQTYIFSREQNLLGQKAQTALTRIAIELSRARAITTANAGNIAFTSSFAYGSSESHTISKTGSTILLDGDVLTDQVQALAFTYLTRAEGVASPATAAKLVGVSITFANSQGATPSFSTRVALIDPGP